jgi:hypothetical protein
VKKTLIPLVLIIIVLSWNFVFTEKKVGLTDQARVLQGLSSAIAYKTAISNYWAQKGRLPSYNDWIQEKPEVSVDISQTIVKSIQVGEDGPGVISVLYTAKPGLDSPAGIDGKKINLIPRIQAAKLVWDCKGTLALDLLPARCSKLITSE